MKYYESENLMKLVPLSIEQHIAYSLSLFNVVISPSLITLSFRLYSIDQLCIRWVRPNGLKLGT